MRGNCCPCDLCDGFTKLRRLDNYAFTALLFILAWIYFIVGPDDLPNASENWQRVLGVAACLYFIYGLSKRLRFVYNPKTYAGIAAKTAPVPKYVYPDCDALSGNAERPDQMPAWALIHRPENPRSLSWLGGKPSVPAGFVWPRNPQGEPLHFLAQINLADVVADPVTGQRPARLPATGAMLIFMGRTYGEDQKDFATRILTPFEQARARPATAPVDLKLLSDLGFWFDDQTFPHCPVDLVSFLDGTNTALPAGAGGHRLFGQTIPEITHPVDLRGQDCLISIASDTILRSQTEHESGFSVWCHRAAMANGDFDTGKAQWHTDV